MCCIRLRLKTFTVRNSTSNLTIIIYKEENNCEIDAEADRTNTVKTWPFQTIENRPWH